ncbi:hypothetical protein PFMG_02782 [Plasmodium falciparum IGH-CR14]|nr:hypothetical protein PFMG_02782 [Plasmodium falciparum IGH-CR14]
MYNKINSFLEKKSKHHSLFGKHKNVPDEEIYFCITNFSLKKVLNDLLENEEKEYIKKIYKKYIES